MKHAPRQDAHDATADPSTTSAAGACPPCEFYMGRCLTHDRPSRECRPRSPPTDTDAKCAACGGFFSGKEGVPLSFEGRKYHARRSGLYTRSPEPACFEKAGLRQTARGLVRVEVPANG